MIAFKGDYFDDTSYILSSFSFVFLCFVVSSWNVILDLCFSICEAGLTQGTPMFLM